MNGDHTFDMSLYGVDQGYGLTPGGWPRAPRKPGRGVYDGPVQALAREGKGATAIEDILKLKRGQIALWMNNPEFKASFRAAQEFAKAQAEGVIDDSLADVAKTMVDIATGKGNYEEGKSELQSKTGLRLLTGRKVLEQGPGVAIDNSRKTINYQRVEVVQEDGSMTIEEKLLDSNPG